jgi:hypothetical protein
MAANTPIAGGSRFNLGYLRGLGINALWLQPIHPRGIDGRLVNPDTGPVRANDSETQTPLEFRPGFLMRPE